MSRNWTEEELSSYYQRLKQLNTDLTGPPDFALGVTPKQPALPTLEEDPTIVLVFRGRVPSKKNNYRPRKGGFYKDSRLQSEIDALALQIPAQYRDLMLESPSVDFFFTYRKANWDRDNAAQCLTDILVEQRVLRNDNIKRHNGRVTIHPAVKGEDDGVRVVLRRAE